MERLVLKILHGAFGIFPGIRIIYFQEDNGMRIKKKHFCHYAYTHIIGQSPAGKSA